MTHEQIQTLYRLQEIQKEINEIHSFRSILQLRGFIEHKKKYILPSVRVETQIVSTSFIFRWADWDIKQIQIPNTLKMSLIHICDEKIKKLDEEFENLTTSKTRK